MRHQWRSLARFGGTLMVLLMFGALVPNPIAAGGQATEVTISGPGLPKPITVTDPLALPALGIATLMEVQQPIPALPMPGAGYDVQRNTFDLARYYPGLSLVHYIGLINGASEYDDHWYRASPIGDETMRRILAQQGIDLPGNSPGTVAIARGATGTTSSTDTAAMLTRTVYPAWPIAVLSLGIFVAASGGYALGRRRRASIRHAMCLPAAASWMWR